MNILFIHGNYPAQFRSIAADLGRQKQHDIRFLTARKDPEKYPIHGVRVHQYIDIERCPVNISTQTQAIANELVQRGEIIQKEIFKLIQHGYVPKLIIFHGGNGLGLFLRQLLPDAVIIGYFEWYFSKNCAKIILNRDDTTTLNYIQARNISSESEILSCDGCVTPTKWQASQFPDKIRRHLTIIFDGVDIGIFNPPESGIYTKPIQLKGEDDGLKVQPEDRLLTYATRGMEPLRGFPELLKALPTLLDRIPNLKVLVGGRDRSAYGPECQHITGAGKR